MTDEEIENLIKEVSEKIDSLADAPEKPLTKLEKKRRVVFQLQKEALERIKAVKEKGGLQQEIRATIDYVILSRYGEKNPLMLYFARLKMKGWLGL